MTKRDLFRILIRLVGVLLLCSIPLGLIPYSYGTGDSLFDNFLIIGVAVVAVVVQVAISLFLIFKGDVIINLLRLDKNYDTDTIGFGKGTALHLVEAAVIIIGGWLLVSNISPLMVELVDWFRSLVARDSFFISLYSNNNTSYMYIDVANVIIGSLLVFNYRAVAGFVFRKSDVDLEAKNEVGNE